MTLSEENYLKTIFHLQDKFGKEVPTNAIAQELQTRASSVTDMIKRLSDKGLVNYIPYQGSSLSESGTNYALTIIRKHRLWEYFLVEKLNFSWDEVHDIAEQLEHIKSEKLTNKLDEFLGYPKVDPHGDLIPDKEGNFATVDQVLLADCHQGDRGIFIGVGDSSKNFLQYLDKQQISLGNTIEVLSKESFDDSFIVKIEGAQKTISRKVASNLFIKMV